MEFDTNNSGDKSPDISDETRLEASTRQKNVTPIHDDVVADDLSDELIVNQHIVQGPLANAANDSEATVGSSSTSAPVKHSTHHFILSLCLITIAIIAALSVFVYIH